MSSEQEQQQIYPNVLADLIISYTQRNNEPIGYFEQKAHMPKNVFLNQAPVDKFNPPRIGSIGCWYNDTCYPRTREPFIVVRNNEWPQSLLVICSRLEIGAETSWFGEDILYRSSSEYENNKHPRMLPNLDEYLYSVSEEAHPMENAKYNLSIETFLQNHQSSAVFDNNDSRRFTKTQIDEIAKQSNSNLLSNKQ